MSDVRGGKAAAIDDNDRLPWLEAVDEDDDAGGPSAAKLVAFVVIGLLAIGLIVGGLFWLGNRGSDSGPVTEGGELIAAPAEDYKVKPDDPGGMKVEGKGDTAFPASEGQEPKGKIDMAALPEEPLVSRTPQPQPGQPKAAPGQTKGREIEVAVAPARPTPAPSGSAATPAATPAAAAGPSGPAIQLGAFSSQASANAAWKNLSGRFGYLAPLTQGVVAVQSGGKTLYRLRATGDIKGICGRLRVAGESCVEVN
jgi:cell division septation protein DedD